MDGLDFLAVQGTLKSLLQHHISKASTLLCSAFFIVQLSHNLNQIPYDYTVEGTNRFKGLDLKDRVPEELRAEVHDILQEAG